MRGVENRARELSVSCPREYAFDGIVRAVPHLDPIWEVFALIRMGEWRLRPCGLRPIMFPVDHMALPRPTLVCG